MLNANWLFPSGIGGWKRVGTTLSPATAGDTLSLSVSQSTATLGAELVTNGTFADADLSAWGSPAGWSLSSGKALHASGGGTAPLTQTISVVNGWTYQVSVTLAGVSAGNVVVAIGAVAMVDAGTTTALGGNTTYIRTLVAGATGSVAFTVTPTTDFNGSVDNVTVKVVTLGSARSVVALVDDAGATYGEIRGSVSLGNIGMGAGALRSVTTGTGNTAQGCYALYSNTTGSSNTAQGYCALYSNTTGNGNTAQGDGALYSNTTGTGNTAQGYYALYSNTTGTGNTAQGYCAGQYQADGVTVLADPENCVYIGVNSRGKDNADDHAIVIGADAIGQGANTATIGSAALTQLSLASGALGIYLGTGAPEGVVTANIGSLYLRKDGGAGTTLYVKQSGTGNTGWVAK